MPFRRLLDTWNRSRCQRTDLPQGRRVGSIEAAIGGDMTPNRDGHWQRLPFEEVEVAAGVEPTEEPEVDERDVAALGDARADLADPAHTDPWAGRIRPDATAGEQLSHQRNRAYDVIGTSGDKFLGEIFRAADARAGEDMTRQDAARALARNGLNGVTHDHVDTLVAQRAAREHPEWGPYVDLLRDGRADLRASGRDVELRRDFAAQDRLDEAHRHADGERARAEQDQRDRERDRALGWVPIPDPEQPDPAREHEDPQAVDHEQESPVRDNDATPVTPTALYAGIQYPEGDPAHGGPQWETWNQDVSNALEAGYPHYDAAAHAEVMRDARAEVAADQEREDLDPTPEPPWINPEPTVLADGSLYVAEEEVVSPKDPQATEPDLDEPDLDEPENEEMER